MVDTTDQLKQLELAIYTTRDTCSRKRRAQRAAAEPTGTKESQQGREYTSPVNITTREEDEIIPNNSQRLSFTREVMFLVGLVPREPNTLSTREVEGK